MGVFFLVQYMNSYNRIIGSRLLLFEHLLNSPKLSTKFLLSKTELIKYSTMPPKTGKDKKIGRWYRICRFPKAQTEGKRLSVRFFDRNGLQPHSNNCFRAKAKFQNCFMEYKWDKSLARQRWHFICQVRAA